VRECVCVPGAACSLRAGTGDTIVHNCGVSAEPELTEHIITASDLFVIIATDGVWDVIESNQAVQIVGGHLLRATAHGGSWDAAEAATVLRPQSSFSPPEVDSALCMQILTSTARRRWESLSPMVDDITAVVIDVRHIHGVVN
jgi:serine/threonine protein phosphatase PrpC